MGDVVGYVTIEEANQYISTHYLSTSPIRLQWESLSDEDKAVLLLNSCEALDRLVLPGRKASVTQEHAFPRWPYLEVPRQVWMAQVENALEMSDPGTSSEVGDLQKTWAYGLSSYSIGDFSESQGIASGSTAARMQTMFQAGVVSAKAQQLLLPFVGGGYCIE